MAHNKQAYDWHADSCAADIDDTHVAACALEPHSSWHIMHHTLFISPPAAAILVTTGSMHTVYPHNAIHWS
jgi:hypothetical protein